MLQVKLFKLADLGIPDAVSSQTTADIEKLINKFFTEHGDGIMSQGITVKDGFVFITYSEKDKKALPGYDKQQMIDVVEGVLTSVQKERLSVEHEHRYWTGKMLSHKPAKKGVEDNEALKLEAKVTQYKGEIETFDSQIAIMRGIIKEIQDGKFTV